MKVPSVLGSKVYSISTAVHLLHNFMCPKFARQSGQPYSYNVCWDPNKINSKYKFVKEWRGRCLEKIACKPLRNVPIDSLVEIGVTFSSFQKVESQSGDVRYSVIGTYIPDCPFQESFKRSLFSTIDHRLKNFISNAITALIGDGRARELPAVDILNTISTIDKIVMRRRVMSKVFELNIVKN